MSKLKSITFKSVQAVMILTVSIVLLYLYEKSQSVSDYITYYGNVTTQNEYHFPERLSSYTFGASDGPVEMDFVNKLVCKPIGTDYTPLVLATRNKHFDSFEFVNKLPQQIITTPIDTRDRISQIGLYDAEIIRNNGEPYLSWSMDSIRPYKNSECYISVVATTYTRIFGLPKSIRFNGNKFTYWTTLRERDFGPEDQPYSEWLKQQTKDYIKYIESL